MKKFALIAALVFAAATLAAAQMDNSKRPSPAASTECKFSDGSSIKVDYSSPRAKGRKIFGTEDEKALVPYGQVWRTGANEATKFVTDTTVKIGGKSLPAGNYTIFTIPNADKWTLIVNKKTGEWGLAYDGSQDLGRVKMKMGKPTAIVENLLWTVDGDGSKGGKITLAWEYHAASVPIAVH